MPKFERADRSVSDFAETIIGRHYQDLHELMTLDGDNFHALKIDFLFVYPDEDENGEPIGHAIMHHGYPAAGLCRIVNLRDRAKGMGDVEIQLDHSQWKDMSRDEQEALLAHEIHHIMPKKDRSDAVVRDDLGRVMIRMRKHDYQLGWFTEIARRYGPASGEVQQAKIIFNKDGESFFPFMQLENSPL